jgi:hypothetical protein
VGTRGQLATPSDSTVEGGPGLVLDNVLDSVPEGALGSQLVHVDQLNEPLGSVVVEGVLEGGECRRRSPQSCLSRGTPSQQSS